jgi:carbon starvation protein
VNQLLAGLALLVASVWLYRRHKPVWVTALPMLFMLVMTGTGLGMLVRGFLAGEKPNVLLGAIGSAILLLQAWMIVEAVLFVVRLRAIKARGLALPALAESA